MHDINASRTYLAFSRFKPLLQSTITRLLALEQLMFQRDRYYQTSTLLSQLKSPIFLLKNPQGLLRFKSVNKL